MRSEPCGETHPRPTGQLLPKFYPTGQKYTSLPPSSPPPKTRETTFGREKDCPLSFSRHSTLYTLLAPLPSYPVPSTNTALRTANTAPSTMRFWDAASRWRSQEERMPTVGLSGEGAEVRGSHSRDGGGGEPHFPPLAGCDGVTYFHPTGKD